MALQLLSSICVEDCNLLKINDTSGLYGVNNLTGWGTPNATKASVTSAIIEITFPGNTIVDITSVVTSTVINSPAVDEFLLKEYTLADLGISGLKLPDGFYKVLYTIIAGGITYTYELSHINYCNVYCCVMNKYAKYAKEGCTCDKDYYDLFNSWIMLKSLMCCSISGNSVEAERQLKKLQKWCSINKCC